MDTEIIISLTVACAPVKGRRVSGSNILIDSCYIEVAGSGDDHADGVQAYGDPSFQQNMQNIIIRNTSIVCMGNILNAGIFFADHSGASLTLENVYVDGTNAPNGAIWLACAVGDIGCLSLIARHVRIRNATTGTFAGRYFRLDPTPSLCNIIEWTDVTLDDGTPIPNPNR